MIKFSELFDLNHTLAKEYIEKYEFPWQVLTNLNEIILEIQNNLDKNEFIEISQGVYVHKSVIISPNSYVGAPTIIGKGSEIRHGAFIRGGVLIGENCVIGNSSEVKNSIVFDSVEIPHFNYVGDSILGYKTHMGAGSICSNARADKKEVVIRTEEGNFETGLLKLGALVGDCVEIGCNAVLNPGSIIGRNSIIYPLSNVRGYLPPNSIFKKQNIFKKYN